MEGLDQGFVNVAPVWQTHGVRMIVRDMGNGVLRIECCELIAAADVEALSNLSGSSALMFPVPGQYQDLVEEAADRMGLAQPDFRITAFARSIDDAAVEIVARCCC